MTAIEAIAYVNDGVGCAERIKRMAAIQLDAQNEAYRKAANKLKKQVNTCHGCNGECNACTVRNNDIVDILALIAGDKKGME